MIGDIKPIKRSKELIPLSKDHHDGLQLCWKINTGINKTIATERIVRYVLNFYDGRLDKHFNEEEEFVFPLLPEANFYRKEAETHHKLLREMIDNLRTDKNESILLLKQLAQLLTEHIRFEERVLFPIIEKETDSKILQALGEKLQNEHTSGFDWEDQFWLN